MFDKGKTCSHCLKQIYVQPDAGEGPRAANGLLSSLIREGVCVAQAW